MKLRTMSRSVISLILAFLFVAGCAAPFSPKMPGPGETWDLVVFGDSESWGMGEFYARFIEEDLGVKVELHDLWKGGLTTSTLLEDLRHFDVVRNAVKDAEVITFIANPVDFIGTKLVGDYSTGKYDCSPAALAGYKGDLEAIIAELFALRKGRPTVIRAMDFYNPLYSDYQVQGTYDEYRRCWIEISKTIHEAAAEHGIPVAEVYAALNGPNYDVDPREKGFIGSDGEHTNEKGREAVAGAFRATGYETITP